MFVHVKCSVYQENYDYLPGQEGGKPLEEARQHAALNHEGEAAG